MADSFADQLRAQLDGIQAELERLDAKRQLIEQLLSLESGSAAATASSADSPRVRRGSRRSAPSVKRPRLPRGLITGKIRELLGAQREPVHATAILAYLEQHEAAPRSAKPMASLQNTLQRLKEQDEVWRILLVNPYGVRVRRANVFNLVDTYYAKSLQLAPDQLKRVWVES